MSHEWTEHEVIYLAPSCGDCDIQKNFSEGRLWCQDPQEPCEECGRPWSKFNLDPEMKISKIQSILEE